MKSILVLLVAARVAAADAPVGATATIDKPAAIVGRDIVWSSDVDERLEQAKLQGDTIGRPAALESLIDERLLISRAKQLHIEVGSAEIDAAIDQIKKQNNVSDQQLDEMLGKVKMTRARYRQQLTDQIMMLKLANFEFRSRVAATDEEIASEAARRNITAPTEDQKRQIKAALIGKKIEVAQTAWLELRKKAAHIERRP